MPLSPHNQANATTTVQLHCERAYITEGRGGTKFHNIPEYIKYLYNYYLYISMRTITMTVFRSHNTKINSLDVLFCLDY